MNTVIMFIKNVDGKIIEKEVEERLVSTYKSIGWEVKKEKSLPKEENSFSNSKRFGK